MDIPAWAVALCALASAGALFSERAMPLFLRVTLATPRLAVFLIYLAYALFDMDMQNRMTITRWLICSLFFIETVSAIFLRSKTGRAFSLMQYDRF